MNILEHGLYTDNRIIRCDCQCKFSFTLDEMNRDLAFLPGIEYSIRCPECNLKFILNENGEMLCE